MCLEDHGIFSLSQSTSRCRHDGVIIMGSSSRRLQQKIKKNEYKYLYSRGIKAFAISKRTGYTAIKNILMTKHPLFNPAPGTLVKYPPKQLPYQSLAQFFIIYEDFLRLRAFITNTASSLRDQAELDNFFSSCLHYSYLNRYIILDRNDPTKAYKFGPGQLVTTEPTTLPRSSSTNVIHTPHRISHVETTDPPTHIRPSHLPPCLRLPRFIISFPRL